MQYQSLCSQLKGFSISRETFGDRKCLILTHKKLFDHPLGLTSRVRIMIKDNEYVVHVLLKEIQCGLLSLINPESQVIEICRKFSLDSPIYQFCSGIDPKEYEEMPKIICFGIKSVRRTLDPFLCVDSVKCLFWFELSSKCTKEQQIANSVMCPACVRLKCDLQRQLNRTLSESPSKRIARQQSSSHAPLCHMSPASQEKRRANQQNDRKNLKKKLLDYAEIEVFLDDEQSDEICSITSLIQNNHAEVVIEGTSQFYILVSSYVNHKQVKSMELAIF